VIAPFLPFISEAIYLQLRDEKDPESVHLCDFPKADPALRDLELEQEMSATQIVVSNAHALRKEHKLKVRQPLKLAHVIVADETLLKALKRQEQLIAEELNVHKVDFSDDESAFVTLICKPNFRVLGKKVGPKMKAVQQLVSQFSKKQMTTLLNGNNLTIEVEGESFELTPEDVSVERQVKEGLVARSEQGITVALDTELNEELLLEGIAREIINKINTMRRDNGYYVTDRIQISIETTDRVKEAFKAHRDLIMQEVLGTEIVFGPCEGTEWDLNGEKTVISLKVV
jgi:isoleucyl-tRNA synthetase